MEVKQKPALKFVESKDGFAICNRFGNPFMHLDERTENELWEYLVKKREKKFNKSHPFKHKVTIQVSERTDDEIRIRISPMNDKTFSGIITMEK